jgi:hypothetical protein
MAMHASVMFKKSSLFDNSALRVGPSDQGKTDSEALSLGPKALV